MDKDNDILQNTIDDRIDAFIRGTMTEEEETAFKQEIKIDPELRRQVLATVSLIKGIREQDAKHENELIHNHTKNKTRSIMLWACSIAALFVILFGVYKEKRYQELSAIVSPYYSEYCMSDYSRGDVDSVAVAHLYTLFDNIQSKRSMNSIIKELEPIYSSLDTNFTYNAYANDIAFNLALAYIKDDQIDKAIPVLEKLKENYSETPIAAKVTELLKKLQD